MSIPLDESCLTSRERRGAEQVTAAHHTLALISGKWTVDVLLAIRERPLRFGMLERELDHIARKVLTQTLRSMQRDGLVWRQSTGVVGKPVEYGLTPLGASLLARVAGLAQWSLRHMASVESSREQFDTLRFISLHRDAPLSDERL